MFHYESIVIFWHSFVKMHTIIYLSLPADDIGGQFGGPAIFLYDVSYNKLQHVLYANK